eukprot:jgi/Ulvmu1/290/UM001_0294.1
MVEHPPRSNGQPDKHNLNVTLLHGSAHGLYRHCVPQAAQHERAQEPSSKHAASRVPLARAHDGGAQTRMRQTCQSAGQSVRQASPPNTVACITAGKLAQGISGNQGVFPAAMSHPGQRVTRQPHGTPINSSAPATPMTDTMAAQTRHADPDSRPRPTTVATEDHVHTAAGLPNSVPHSTPGTAACSAPSHAQQPHGVAGLPCHDARLGHGSVFWADDMHTSCEECQPQALLTMLPTDTSTTMLLHPSADTRHGLDALPGVVVPTAVAPQTASASCGRPGDHNPETDSSAPRNASPGTGNEVTKPAEPHSEVTAAVKQPEPSTLVSPTPFQLPEQQLLEKPADALQQHAAIGTAAAAPTPPAYEAELATATVEHQTQALHEHTDREPANVPNAAVGPAAPLVVLPECARSIHVDAAGGSVRLSSLAKNAGECQAADGGADADADVDTAADVRQGEEGMVPMAVGQDVQGTVGDGGRLRQEAAFRRLPSRLTHLRMHNVFEGEDSDASEACTPSVEASAEDGSGGGGSAELEGNWPFVRDYAAKAGGVSEQIGGAARQEAARDEFIADAMARLRQGLISLEDFRLYMQSRSSDEAAQAVKRLAQLAVDVDRDVARLSVTLTAFERLSDATKAHEVEAAVAECLLGALGLAGARLFLVDRRRKRATSCSGPKATTSWKAAALDQQPSLVAWAAKLGIGLAVTDTTTERRYNPAVDGTATSLLTLPLRSDGTTGDLLAVLSLRKVAARGGGGKNARPTGFNRDEETFARAVVQATGPFLYTVQTAAAARRALEEEVVAVERMQLAGARLLRCVAAGGDLPNNLARVAAETEQIARQATRADAAALYMLDAQARAMTTLTPQHGFSPRERFPIWLSSVAETVATAKAWRAAVPALQLRAADRRRQERHAARLTCMLAVPLTAAPAIVGLLQRHTHATIAEDTSGGDGREGGEAAAPVEENEREQETEGSARGGPDGAASDGHMADGLEPSPAEVAAGPALQARINAALEASTQSLQEQAAEDDAPQDPERMLDDGDAALAGAGKGGGGKQLLAGVLTVYSKRPEGGHEDMQPAVADGTIQRRLSYPDPFYPQDAAKDAGPEAQKGAVEFTEEDAALLAEVAGHAGLVMGSLERGRHREEHLVFTQRLTALWHAFLKEAPRLHCAATTLPAAARAVAGMGVRLLGCTYSAVYHVRAPRRGFAEADSVRTHVYAAVQGRRRIDAAPLRRRSRAVAAAAAGIEAPAVFKAVRRKKILRMHGAACLLQASDAAFFEGFSSKPAEVDAEVDPLAEEDWQRRPPEHRSHMIVVPVLCPHYGHFAAADDDHLPGGAAHQTAVSTPSDNVALVPGLPTGKPTKLPVIAALVLAWSAVAGADGADAAAGYSPEKEQIVYALAEQACMVLWNCL